VLASREARLATRRADTSVVANVSGGAGASSASDLLDIGAPLARWELPGTLGEISGLALLPEGRLLAHDDERARIAVIDPRIGVVQKEFYVGDRGTKGDFEGIAVVGDTIYLMTSRGVLFAFREGDDHGSVPYVMHDTKLGKECEFEGLVHDPTTHELVMPCKHLGDARLKDNLVLYRLALPLSKSSTITRLTIPIEQLRATHPWKGLHPSDITRDPVTGHYVLVAAAERALIEITPDGGVVRAVPLPDGHEQTEGVAITTDSVLIISDEARAHAASITLYRWPTASGRRGS
jgi:uncharacterized protein YjiK